MNVFILDIIEFYKKTENLQAFEEWKQKKDMQAKGKEATA